MGYINWSMSERAREAYRDGEKPLSKWGKSDLLYAIKKNCDHKELTSLFEKVPLNTLKSLFLKRSSWHHTGKMYNKTDFYSVDYDAVDRATIDLLNDLIKNQKCERKMAEKIKPINIYKTARVGYTHWTGTRKHPKPNYCEEVVYYRGNDKLVSTQHGKKRLSSLTIYDEIEQKTKYAPAKKVLKKKGK